MYVLGGGGGGVGNVARSHMREQQPKGKGRASGGEITRGSLGGLARRLGFVSLLVANSKHINRTDYS